MAGFKHKLVVLGHLALARVVGSPVDLEQEPSADLHTNMDTRNNGKSVPLGSAKAREPRLGQSADGGLVRRGEGLWAPGYKTVLENVVDRSSESPSLVWLSEVGSNLGSWNVRSGLLGQPGKVEAVATWAKEHNVGVLGLQETMVPGIGQQWLADGWTLVTGGGLGRARAGTGFLIHGDLRVVGFEAQSPCTGSFKE